MADRSLILSADNYSIPDKSTGEIQELFQIWYCSDYREASDTELGSKPIKMLTTPEIFEQLKKVQLPAIFDMELRSRPGKANAASLTVVSVKFLSTPSIFPSVAAEKKAA